ncbi:MAG TPA: PAS domain-containing protein [Polyangiaceae bacterium]|nr:PAS domain-containing protein [Polyangiaceae bacterium]
MIRAINGAANIDEALRSCLDELRAALGASVAHGYLQAAPGTFVSSVSSGDDERYAPLREALRKDLRPGDGVAGQAVVSGFVHRADVAAHPAAHYADAATQLGMVSACAIPLLVGKTVMGVIELFSTRPTEVDDDLLATIGLLLGPQVERLHVGAQLRANQAQLHAILDNCPASIYVKDPAGKYLMVNQVFEEWFGTARAAVIGKTDYDLMPPEIAAPWQANDRRVLSSQAPVKEEEDAVFDGERRTYLSIKFPIRDAQGAPYAICGVTTDITDRKRAEEANARARLQDETIRVQAETLAQLSTPLIPFSESILVMPLIGAVDSQRAQRVLSTLLEGVARRKAQSVIVDITGITVTDTGVVSILVNAARALRMLGAETVITGIRADVAQTIVNLGMDLSTLTTEATLQSGIAFALRQSDGSSPRALAPDAKKPPR